MHVTQSDLALQGGQARHGEWLAHVLSKGRARQANERAEAGRDRGGRRQRAHRVRRPVPPQGQAPQSSQSQPQPRTVRAGQRWTAPMPLRSQPTTAALDVDVPPAALVGIPHCEWTRCLNSLLLMGGIRELRERGEGAHHRSQ